MSFGVEPRRLKQLVDLYSPGNKAEELKYMLQLRGEEELFINLETCPFQGISQNSIEDRRNAYGSNQLQIAVSSPASILWEAFNHTLIIVPAVAAALSFVVGLISRDHSTGHPVVEAFFAILIIVANWLLRSCEGFWAARRLLNTSNKIEEGICLVVRDNQREEVEVIDLVVGDIIEVRQGDTVPADGWLVEGAGLVAEQTHTAEKMHTSKGTYRQCIGQIKQSLQGGVPSERVLSHMSPVLLSGSRVTAGTGRMVVLAVGKLSHQGMSLSLAQQHPKRNILKDKVQSFSISLLNIILTLSLVTLSIELVLIFLAKFGLLNAEWSIVSVWDAINTTCLVVLSGSLLGLPAGIMAGCLVIKAKMWHQDHLWVHYCEDCTKMTSVTDLFYDKEEESLQASFEEWWNEQIAHFGSQHNGLQPIELKSQKIESEGGDLSLDSVSLQFRQLMQMSISFKAATHPGYPLPSTEGVYRTSKELSEWQLFIKKRKDDKFLYICEEGVVKFVLMQQPSPQGRGPIMLVLGESQQVMDLCKHMLSKLDGELKILNQALREEIQVIDKSMSRRLATTYAVAYQNLIEDVSLDDYAASLQQESSMNFLCLLGGGSPMSNSDHQTVRRLRESGVNLVLMSEKEHQVAMTRAKYLGVISADEETVSLHGSDLMRMAGEVVCSNCKHSICLCLQEDPHARQFKHLEKFSRITRYLRVLSEATYWHKYALQVGYKNLRSHTCCLARIEQDLPALGISYLGLTAEETTKLQPYATVILPHATLSQVLQLLLWSRMGWQFVRRFLQLSIPASIVVVVIQIMGGLVLGCSPFRLGEVLWAPGGLILLFGIALSWQSPKEDELKENDVFKEESDLFSEPIVRQIVSQIIWQSSVILMVLLTGHLFLPESSDSVDDQIGSDWTAKYSSADRTHVANGLYYNPLLNTPSYKPSVEQYSLYSRHLTIAFNCYALMTIFNYFNCRKAQPYQLNILQDLTWPQALIWLSTSLAHFFFMGLSPEDAGLYPNPMTITQWLFAVGTALSVWILGFVVRLLPPASKPETKSFRWRNKAINLGVKLMVKKEKLKDFEMEEDIQLKWQ